MGKISDLLVRLKGLRFEGVDSNRILKDFKYLKKNGFGALLDYLRDNPVISGDNPAKNINYASFLYINNFSWLGFVPDG